MPNPKVAPLVGAWIEIQYPIFSQSNTRRSSRGSVDWNVENDSFDGVHGVAPLVGAWIEICD